MTTTTAPPVRQRGRPRRPAIYLDRHVHLDAQAHKDADLIASMLRAMGADSTLSSCVRVALRRVAGMNGGTLPSYPEPIASAIREVA